MKELSIYVHIPFCVQKCRYCDFLSFPAKQQEKEEYVELLLREIEYRAQHLREYRVISVFFGGGTPSVLNEDAIEKILCKLKECFSFGKEPEITIEVNPGTVTKQKLAVYWKAGINRLSIGLQSANEEELRTLGRIHTYTDFCRTYEWAREVGFANINVDLMAAIPGQTRDSYRETIQKILVLQPEHISAYSLILEEGTWFYEHQKELTFPDEDEDRALYRMTGEMLEEAGYFRYEISNYAKEGYECLHNKVYWQRGDYLGLGLGAASLLAETRYTNKQTLQEYREVHKQWVLQEHRALHKQCDWKEGHTSADEDDSLYETVEHLTRQDQMEEFLFLGLRLTKGIQPQKFYEKFGVPIEEVYADVIEKLQKEGLLLTDNTIRLTGYGLDVSNYVMAQFLL